MMVNVDAVTHVMSRKQIRSIMECSARINIWSGAVRSGKTIASLLAFLFALVRAPHNGIIFVVGRTIQTVERNLIEVLQQHTGPFGPISRYVHHTRGSNTAVILGRVVHLVGANDVTAEGRIRGATAALIYIDEATLIPEAFFTMCLSRLSVRGSKLLCTTNPDGPMHWLRQKFMLRPELNLRQWHFTLDDNPSLDPSYVRDLKAEYTGLFYRRFILGEWCLAEGAVYSSWDPDRHVVTDLPIMSQWVALGIDYGTVNPFAAEMIGLGADGRLYVTSEYYYDSRAKMRELTDLQYANELIAWMGRVPVPGSTLRGIRPRYVVLDPSAASFRRQLHNLGVTSVHAKNDVMQGIRTVSSLLASGRLLVHESCTGLIAEFPSYSWDPKAAEKGEDAPLKVDDHALDATRYGIFTVEALWRNKLCDPDDALVAA